MLCVNLFKYLGITGLAYLLLTKYSALHSGAYYLSLSILIMTVLTAITLHIIYIIKNK
jgi:hypothetical protein